MAFGFGFNKQKVLSTAEKFVQQGKLPNAIAEYEKILKADPKDLTVSNTVGDLYSRLGDNDKAVECFKTVGDAYASQGFTVKAIAMYKKLSKCKPSMEASLRLAELYTQQGLFNDARAQYLQVAEEFLHGGQLDQAVRIFQKTLEMDPENLAMRLRLAEVYVRLGKKDDARQVYSAAIESLRAKGQLDAAEEILQRLVKLDPGSSEAVLMQARNALDAGDFASAAQQLEKVPDLDGNPEALRSLFHCYLQLGRLADAGALAPKLFPTQTDAASISAYAEALLGAGQYEDVLTLYRTYGDRLLAEESTQFLNSLHSMIGPLSENTAALGVILDLLNQAGDKSHDTEIYELLAHAHAHAEDFEKARDYYAELVQLEPQNAIHAQNYQQMLGRLAGAPATQLVTAEEGAVWLDELEATAPFIDQRHDDQVALAVRAAITDAELFLSYNMPGKALLPLLTVLPQAPSDLRLNQRLAALHTRASRFAEAAVCCRTLESLYHDAGHPGEAARYGEIAAKYEDRASVQGAAPAVAFETPAAEVAPVEEFSEPEVPPVIIDAPDAAPEEPAEFDVQAETASSEGEIDLSNEWEATPSEEVPVQESDQPAPADDLAVAETIEEIRFYLEQSMIDQARAAFGKLEQLTSDTAMVEALRAEIETAAAKVPSSESEVIVEPTESIEAVGAEVENAEVGVASFEAEAPVVQDLEVVASETHSASEAHSVAASVPAIEESPAAVMPEKVAEIPVVPAAVAAAPEQAPEAVAEPVAPPPSVLNELVVDLESSLGNDFLPGISAQESTPVSTPAPKPAPEAAPQIAASAQPAGPQEADTLGDFVSDLESSLGDSFLAAAPVPQAEVMPAAVENKAAVAASSAATPASVAPAAMSAAASAVAGATKPPALRSVAPPPAPATSVDSAAGVDLADMFGELKQELNEDAANADEDPETHYNLGVAFREMGLLDEAIGELQKVCQSVERGHAFPQIMQTYTWLAQCFLDKGIPEAALRWYQRALQLPNLDGETRTALHYELASAQEAAGDKPAALNHFMEVYGSNIDYRDVGERIKALKS